MSFLSSAKRVSDISTFLKEAAGGNSVKYTSKSGAKDVIYIPYVKKAAQDANGTPIEVKELIAIYGHVHEWDDGKYHSCVCLKDVVNENNGVMVNDGTCPFCDRVQDAWEIYKYRKDIAEGQCTLVGEARDAAMKEVVKQLLDQRKIKEATPYMYMLVAVFNTDTNGQLVLGDNNEPTYELKVMKLSNKRVEKLEETLGNSGMTLPGAQIVIKYADSDDRRVQISQSTTSPVFGNTVAELYPNVIKKIDEDVAAFDWESLDKSFPEWSGMSTAAAKQIMDESFSDWDSYKKELEVNSGAKYLEYATTIQTTNPALAPATDQAPKIPGVAPQIELPNVAVVEQPAPVAQAAPAEQVAPVGQAGPVVDAEITGTITI